MSRTNILDLWRFGDDATKRYIERKLAAGELVERFESPIAEPGRLTSSDRVVDEILARLETVARTTTNPPQRIGVQNAIRIIRREFVHRE